MPGGVLSAVLPDLGRRTLIMGILNVTPDSFSDGAAFLDPDAALDHALALMDDGADLIDVGGETTRPGSEGVSAEIELGRVLPVITRLAASGVGPISIDTSKAEVARAALAAGAHLVNDISGGSFDPEMLGVVAASGVPIVLMHTPKRPRALGLGRSSYGGDVVGQVVAALGALIDAATAAGVSRDAIIVDPGIGFGKDAAQNVALIAGLGELARLGRPILIGTSRKSFIGELTGRPVTAREYGTAATVALAIARGASIVRVHDVAAMSDVVRVADAVTRAAGVA